MGLNYVETISASNNTIILPETTDIPITLECSAGVFAFIDISGQLTLLGLSEKQTYYVL